MHPIISSLTRHKLTVLLVIINVAFTFAVVCNVIFMIQQRLDRITQPTGLDDHNLSIVYSESENAENILPKRMAELAILKGIAGVKSVATVDAFTLGNDSVMGVSSQSTSDKSVLTMVSAFGGSQDEAETLGLDLLEGRDFVETEYMPSKNGEGMGLIGSAIVTQALATRLFGRTSATGRQLYLDNGRALRVVGVVRNILRPRPTASVSEDNQFVVLLPLLPDDASTTYVLRSDSGERARVLKEAERLLSSADPNRILSEVTTFDQIREEHYAHDRETILLLTATGLTLLLVTALGIGGLSNFWVQQRRRAIGVRRALGATRLDILKYFVIENFFLISAGLVVGILAAFAMNQVLMKFFEVSRLPVGFLPVAAITLWAIGFLAVLGPAMKASKLEPAIATKA